VLGVLILAAATLAPAHSQSANPSPPSGESAAPVRLTAQDAAELAEKRVPAAYPEKARANGIQGDVVLNVLISETGDVKESSVASGDPDLAQAAIESVKQWKYRPYIIDGKPTPVATRVTFSFHIKGPPPLPPPGSFHDGTYVDEFFGIRYPLSTEWVRETTLMRKQLAMQSSSPSSAQVLLAALHVPARSDGLVADSSMVMVAAPQPAQTDAKKYLASVSEALSAEKMAKPRGDSTAITIAGLTAYRADFKPSSGEAQYQSILCAMAKGYVLRWNFLAVSESALDDAVATVSAIIPNVSPPAASAPTKASDSPGIPADPPRVEVVRVSSGVTVGLLVKKVEPRYPPNAKSAHIQGQVLLHARIDKSGNIIDLEAISGPVELIPPTVDAVRQWKYKPYLLKGEPVELDTTVEVRYVLGG
jgi:TonB family protein